MPVYQCYSPKGLLSNPVKAKIADEITINPTNATGAKFLTGTAERRLGW
jgi:phenylpyruvate tautomerase PptA (4-oxalocrotonate tautomerase family)